MTEEKLNRRAALRFRLSALPPWKLCLAFDLAIVGPCFCCRFNAGLAGKHMLQSHLPHTQINRSNTRPEVLGSI